MLSKISTMFINGAQLAPLVLAAMLVAPDALAQTSNSTGVGVALGIGSSSIEDEDSPGETFDGSDFGWNVDVEWRFIKHLAIGANWTSLGEDTDDVNGTETTIGVDGLGVFLRGYWPVTSEFTLHARYGETSYNVDIEPGFGTVFPFSDSAKDFGIGGDYYLNDNLAVRIEARWLDGPDKEAGGLTTIGLRWQF
ncbi:MAG: outer membrane beta-barrel protein [Woeseiaceae bacterium]|nr:outer membrane beta-barrel protein [Woeseiaceae bacterium]